MLVLLDSPPAHKLTDPTDKVYKQDLANPSVDIMYSTVVPKQDQIIFTDLEEELNWKKSKLYFFKKHTASLPLFIGS